MDFQSHFRMQADYYHLFLNWCDLHNIRVVHSNVGCIVFLVEEQSQELLFLICHIIRQMELKSFNSDLSFQVTTEGNTCFTLQYYYDIFQWLLPVLSEEKYPFICYHIYFSLVDLMQRLALYSPYVSCQICDNGRVTYMLYVDGSAQLNSISPIYQWSMNCHVKINDPVFCSSQEVSCGVLAISSDEEVEEYVEQLDSHIELRKIRHEFQ